MSEILAENFSWTQAKEDQVVLEITTAKGNIVTGTVTGYILWANTYNTGVHGFHQTDQVHISGKCLYSNSEVEVVGHFSVEPVKVKVLSKE